METRFYVPKLQAIKNILAKPQAFQVKLPVIANHPYFQSVPLPRDMDVSVAAKLAEITVEDFRALNPSANRSLLLAAGQAEILLPWDNAETFQRNYEAFGGGRLASWTAWVAPSTMKVADAAKRVGMSESEFRHLNNIPPRMMVKAGSVLLVPRVGALDRDVDALIADGGQLSLTAEPMPSKGATVHTKKRAGKAKTQTSSPQTPKTTVATQVKPNQRPKVKTNTVTARAP
jgi:membrane-bound lytic murein transglycosylase D